MKKNFILAAMAIVASACLCSCAPDKNSAMKKLERITNDVEANYKEYTQADWEQFMNDYREADSLINVFRKEYTQEELEAIGRNKGRCAGYLVKGAVNKGKQQLESAGKKVKSMIEGFSDAVEKQER
ncbi:MAG: hypothetical protein Q4B58_06005 [Bacteroidales bacterium]|nr:hypothetical protein [Bacteroidales bacterium]